MHVCVELLLALRCRSKVSEPPAPSQCACTLRSKSELKCAVSCSIAKHAAVPSCTQPLMASFQLSTDAVRVAV